MDFYLELAFHSLMFSVVAAFFCFVLDHRKTEQGRVLRDVCLRTGLILSGVFFLAYSLAAMSFPEAVRTVRMPWDLLEFMDAIPSGYRFSISLMLAFFLLFPAMFRLNEVLNESENLRLEKSKLKIEKDELERSEQEAKDLYEKEKKSNVDRKTEVASLTTKMSRNSRSLAQLSRAYEYVISREDDPEDVKKEVKRRCSEVPHVSHKKRHSRKVSSRS